MESQQILRYIFINLLMMVSHGNCGLRPLQERTCAPSFVCIHGKCSGLFCLCDAGWKGGFCDTSRCKNDCVETETCMLVDGTFACVQNNNDFTNVTTDIITNDMTLKERDSSITTEANHITTERSLISSMDSSYPHVCSADYELRPERKCKNLPFNCVYGFCKETMSRTQIEIQCICDPGSYGSICEKKCCKNCNEPFGQCRHNVKNKFREVCNCRYDFTGENCQINRTEAESIADPSPQSLIETTIVPTVTNCINDSMCINGYCAGNQCVCNNEWAGSLCDKRCPFACFTPRKCVFKDEQFSCQEDGTINQTPPPTEVSYNVTIKEPVSSNLTDVCSGNYQLRPERICPHVTMECVYGVCDVTRMPDRFEIKCKCDPGSYGGRCEKICCKQCNEPYGQCRLNGTNHERCECHHSYYGKHCEFKRLEELPEDTSWTRWVIYGSVFVVFGLIAMVVVILYCMWKHRVLMVMKLVHKFQPFEDGDDKDYDAFVSYRSLDADEQFVYNYLYPKLEREMGFKLCLHCRDFIPGETIANNIISAIKNSRRTILILSPEYINSEWTKFEYQFAQREMLKRKHRIIPIMFTDVQIKDDVDQNLRLIIESVTFIKWPEGDNMKTVDHFWKQLQLSMPKKRRTSHSEQRSPLENFPICYRELDGNGSPHSERDRSSGKSLKQDSKSLNEDRDSGSFHSFIDDDQEEQKTEAESKGETTDVLCLDTAINVQDIVTAF